MLRVIGYCTAALVAVVAVGAGAVLAVDLWRGSGPLYPLECGFLLHEARGDLRTDDQVLDAAWAAVSDPDAEVDSDLDGPRPELDRSCVLFAGRTPAGTTVVFAERTFSIELSLIKFIEVRVPDDGGNPAQLAVATHSTRLGSEMRAGLVLPLSGYYLAPYGFGERTAEVDTVTVFSAADGYATARQAPAVGEGLFDIQARRELTVDPQRFADVDALLLLRGAEVDPFAVALPAGPPEPIAVTSGRASYQLVVRPELGPIDEATLRTIGPALSAMSADPRYSLIRDFAIRPTALVVNPGSGALTITANGRGAEPFPSFSFPG